MTVFTMLAMSVDGFIADAIGVVDAPGVTHLSHRARPEQRPVTGAGAA